MSLLLSLSIFGASFAGVNAGLFLAKLPEPELKEVLLSEIEAALGSELHHVTKQRFKEIEDAIRPTFDILPKKGSEGRLDHDGVRYLLNRVFAQQHGWFINGLQQGADTWNNASSLSMRDHLPEVLQELFESKVGETGASLNQVVSFAAMIEHLIRDELRGKLETIYGAKRMALDTPVERAAAANLMELYMICFLRGEDASNWTPEKIERLEQRFHRQYPEWDGVKELITDIQDAASPTQEFYGFDDVASVLEVVADRFADFYENQCLELKGALLDREERRSGRVRLGDFYHAALHDGMYQFTETAEVLRHIGVLDEVDSSNPRIIIPNYIAGMSNCIARTSFYSTCCPNSCESLLNRIERSLGKSEATVEEIILAVEDPSAALETGFHGLTSWQKQRLSDLGKHHQGSIPLHGRLFAQWMHFVHPRDCVYPHVAGSTYKKSLDEWEREVGKSSGLTLQQLKDVTEHLNDAATQAESLSFSEESHEDPSRGMWTMEEELFVDRPSAAQYVDPSKQRSGFATTLMFVLTFLGAVVALTRMRGPSSPKSNRWTYDSAALMAKNV